MNAQDVKELRKRTGAGFLDIKNALEASNGNMDEAIEYLKERGIAKAAKKAGAIAAEGIVQTLSDKENAVIFEINSQTDFVAKNESFQKLVNKIGNALLINKFGSVDDALKIQIDGETIESILINATATIGEKITLRRVEKFSKLNHTIGAYTHVNQRVASLVITDGGEDIHVRNVAMHVASMSPQYLDEASVPAEIVTEMRAEIESSPVLEGKPDNIKENIAKGMLRKQLSELTLVDQEFVMEKMPVSKYLKDHGAKPVAMVRFEVGEGIEKKEENFAEEVAAQMGK